MKKYILFIAFIFAVLFTQAQVVNGYSAFPKDSTTNSQTKYLKILSPVAINGNYTVGIVVVPTNKSGTETVKAMLQGSWDNSSYFDLTTDSVTLNTAGTVKVYGWELQSSTWKYYRVKAVGHTAAGVTTFMGGLVLKKKY